MAAHPHTHHPHTHPSLRPGSPALRRLTAMALVAAPAVLLLGAPATAAPVVAVTPLAGACGLAVDVSGLAEGPHVLVVRTTVLATGADVPVVEGDPVVAEDGAVSDEALDRAPDPAPDEAVAGEAATEEPTEAAPAGPPAASPPAAGPPPSEPRLEAVLTVDGDAAAEDAVREVALDASAVPDDERWVRVSLELDGAVLSVADLELTVCGDPVDLSLSPTPSATPSTSPSTTSSPSVTPTPSVSPSASPSASASATPSPSATGAATSSATATPSPSVAPTPSASASPSATPGRPAPAAPAAAPVVTDPLLADPLLPEPVPTAADVRTPLGTGTSGARLLVLSAYATTPQTGTVPVVRPVPDPVVAPLEGVPAGSLTSPGPTPSPLAGLLPALPARGEPAQPRALAFPTDLPVRAAGDPLVDLAPAGFLLAASFGGLLMSGRRRGA